MEEDKTDRHSFACLDDTDLIDIIIHGRTNAFEVLTERYKGLLYKIGKSFRLSHQDIQDLVQDTFIQAFRNLDKLHERVYFKTWIIKIMLNECYRKCHSGSSEKFMVTHTLAYNEGLTSFTGGRNFEVAEKLIRRELNTVIENAIHVIPLKYRLVFTFRVLNGMSLRDTANLMLISESNVKVRLNRAKAMLRKEVEKTYKAQDIFLA